MKKKHLKKSLLEFSSELKDFVAGSMSNMKMNGESVRMLCSEAEQIPPFLSRGNSTIPLDSK